MGNYILIGLAIIAVVILLLTTVKIHKNKKQKKIYAKISCDNGTFFAQGNKKSFKIKKDNRYVFKIADGRIVYVKERQGFFYRKVVY